MYLYDAQTGKIHLVTETLKDSELKAFGYQGITLEFVYKLCYAMGGLDGLSDEEANKVVTTRLFYIKRLLIAHGRVHDVRADVVPTLPGLPAMPRLVFAKFRHRFINGDLHDYRYVLSDTPFDEPVFGSLDHL